MANLTFKHRLGWPSSPLSLGGHSCSRMFATVVKMCALENGGQHLFFLYKCWMVIFFFFVRGRSVVRARINEELYFFLDRPFLFVQCHFDLIGLQVNKYQADSFRGYSKTPNSTRSLLGLIRLNFVVPNGSVSTWTCHVPRNQSGPRKFAVSSSASKARSHHCER